jgi:signal transduction histidine kinase
MRKLLVLFFLLLGYTGFAQVHPERVSGLPTNELNDLHIDQKGYLWIAHGLGISRYDGSNFISFAHPVQISLRTTDIVEDHHGRIWFHNFSGQVFYIENGNIHLLESYDFKGENQNPRMVLCGNELLITSYKGLFVCNTDNFATRLFPFPQPVPTAIVSLAVLHNEAVVYNNQDWYTYKQGRFLKTALVSSLQLPADNFVSLQPTAYNDTLYLTANPSGILYKLRQENGRLKLLGKQEYHDFISAVSVDKEAWVHTRNQSINLQNGRTINNADLTDVVFGKEGSTWYCSRREGLLVNFRPPLWQQIRFQINKEDYIRSLNAGAGYFFAGTQKGNLYRFETDTSDAGWMLELFNGFGSIDFIRYLKNDLFIVGSSTDTYIVNARERRIVVSLPIKAIQDVDFDGSSFYVATAGGLYVVPYLEQSHEKGAWLQKKREQFSAFNWKDSGAAAYLLFPQGTRSVRFDSFNYYVYAAAKNGLYEVNEKGAHPYLINGKEVFATAVAFRKTILYVATANDGLWMIDGKKVQHFTTANLLASNTIMRIKLTKEHLWLFEKGGIQVLDIYSGRILQNLDFPSVEGANVLDVAEKDDFGYLALAKGVYKVPLNLAVKRPEPKAYLDYVIVKGKDTVLQRSASLSYQQNDIQFYFSSPAFHDPELVSFRYRLEGADNEWQVTAPGERMIRYPALAPGDYEFAFYAVDNNGMQQQELIRFPFSVQKPLWRTGWFILLVNAVLAAIIYLAVKNRVNQKLRLEVMRRNISNDLHDDIGATLSSVNFYIDLARSEKQNADYLGFIKENVNQVIGSLDDLVWSINPKNDTTGQFINRMKDYATPLLKATRIRCHFNYEPRLLDLKLDLLTKRHLYLLFKEMVNNVAKHACCHNCFIELSHAHGKLCLVVKDDGQGFDSAGAGANRNGLSSMQERARKLRGELAIRSAADKGSQVAVTIPL